MASSKSIKTLQKLKLPRPKIVKSPTFKVIFLHLVVFVGLFAILGFTVKKFNSFLTPWSFQTVFLATTILGILHVWLLYSSHDWVKRDNLSGLKELAFTIVVYLFGLLGFYASRNQGDFNWASLFSSTTVFLFPFLWDKSTNSWFNIPKKPIPSIVIANLEKYRGRFEITANKEAIFFHFIGPEKEDWPGGQLIRMYMPTAGKEYSLKELLIAFLLNYKYNLKADTPIQHKYEHQGKVFFYKWQFFSKNLINRQVILDPGKTIKGNRLKFKKWRGKDGGGREIIVDRVEMFIKRLPNN